MNKLLPILLILLSSLYLHGCSGDAGTAGDGPDVTIPPPGGTGGGIGGSGYSLGTLSGLGSIFVNGLRFDTDTAEFSINQQLASQDQLRVGMQITAAVDFEEQTAQSIVYTASLIGPVTVPPDATGQLSILNQPVKIVRSTIIDGFSILELVAGSTVEVSGIVDSSNTIIATYLRRSPNSNSLVVTGPIQSLSADRQGIVIRGLTIDISQTNFGGADPQQLMSGQSVVITATLDQYSSSSATLVASTLRPALSITPDADTAIEFSGFVSAFDTTERFTVDSFAVLTNSETSVESISGTALNPSNVALNSRLEVEGTLTTNGEVIAGKVVLIPSEDSKLIGQIESIDPNTQSLTLFGIEVRSTLLTQYKGDDSSFTMNFDGLRVGDYVEVEASFIENRLVASKVEVEEPDDDARLEGPVTRVIADQGLLEVLGVPLVFGPDSEFEIDVSTGELEVGLSEFLNQVEPGEIVQARWRNFTSVLNPVDSVELE